MCNLSDLIEERGIAKGITIGKNEGITIGKTEGIESKTKAVVINMLKRGMEECDIMALAECSQSFIEAVRKELGN